MTERDFVHRGFGGVVRPGDVAPGVVLVRTREAAAALAATWDDARHLADHYAFSVWAGRLGDVPVAACSTGTGSASAAIAIEELAILGARTFVGVGAVRDPLDARGGAVLVAEGAWRADAASAGYARAGFPAVPDPAVVVALARAAGAAGLAPRPAILADIEASLDARIAVAGPGVPEGAGVGPGRRPGPLEALDAAVREASAVPVHGSPAVLFVAGAVHGLAAGFLAGADAPDAQARLHAVAGAALVGLAGGR